MRRQSAAVTADAVRALEHALAVLAPWFDQLLAELQTRVAAQAEDGKDLLERWSAVDWSVIARDPVPLLPHVE